MKPKAYLGGIVKISVDNMYGFQVGFEDQETANKYKEMLYFILNSDKFNTFKENAMFDMKEYRK